MAIFAKYKLFHKILVMLIVLLLAPYIFDLGTNSGSFLRFYAKNAICVN